MRSCLKRVQSRTHETLQDMWTLKGFAETPIIERRKGEIICLDRIFIY